MAGEKPFETMTDEEKAAYLKAKEKPLGKSDSEDTREESPLAWEATSQGHADDVTDSDGNDGRSDTTHPSPAHVSDAQHDAPEQSDSARSSNLAPGSRHETAPSAESDAVPMGADTGTAPVGSDMKSAGVGRSGSFSAGSGYGVSATQSAELQSEPHPAATTAKPSAGSTAPAASAGGASYPDMKISGDLQSAVTEDKQVKTSGQLTVSGGAPGPKHWLLDNRDGQYGSLELDSQGHWQYTLNNDAHSVQALAQGQEVSDTFNTYITDAAGRTQVVQLVVAVRGTNDAASVTGMDAGVATEDFTPEIMGALKVHDIDPGESSFTPQADVPGSHGLGHFSVNKDGHWTYRVDDSLPAVQALGKGQSLTDSTTVTTADGTQHTITVTIEGSNDGPVIQQASASTHEDAQLLTGQMQATDTDKDDHLTFSTSMHVEGFTLNADGSWTLDPSHPAYQSLAAGEPRLITIPVTVTDSQGATDQQDLSIMLTGTDDAPKLQSMQVWEVNEDAALVSERIQASDVDHLESLIFSIAHPVDGLSFYPDGSWTFDPSHPAFQSLAAGEVKELHVPVTVTDHSGLSDTRDFVIKVTGTNDKPTITTNEPPLSLDEGSAIVQGDFAATDHDSTDLLKFSTPVPVPGFAIDEQGHWTFDPSDPAYNKMPAGDIKKLNIPVIVNDGHGGTDQHILQITLNGTNDKPEIQVTPLRNVQEDHVVQDKLVVSDPDSGDTLMFSVPGNVDGFTLHADGSYTFDAAHPAYQLLRQDEVRDVSVPVIVTDSQGEQSWTTLTFRLHGTNDVPAVGGISHAIGALDTAVGGTLRVEGNLSVVDADKGESSFQPQLLQGSYGVLAITPDGHWSYTADARQSALHSLTGFQHLPEDFRVLTADGTPHDIHLDIKGDNTPAIFGNVLSGMVKEDVTTSVTQKATIIDPDAGENYFQPVDQDTAHGHIKMDADGTWTYTLNTANAEVQALAETKSLTERILIGSVDGTPHFLTVLIAGTNDAPVISGTSSGVVKEDVGSGSVSETLTGTDVDAGDTLTWSLEGSGQGTYGTFSLDTATGTWTYQIDNSLPAVNELAAGDSQPETFAVLLTDKLGVVTRHEITVTVDGTNDAPVIASTAVFRGGVTEDAASNTVSGTLAATDVDSGASLTWSLDQTDGSYGSITIDPHTGTWTYSLDNSLAATQSLAGGHVEQETFTATVTDEHGELVHHTITIDVTGTNDAAVITDMRAAPLIREDIDLSRDGSQLYTSGKLSISDVDTGEARFAFTQGLVGSGGYGRFTLAPSGAWGYLCDGDNPQVQALPAGKQVTDSVEITSIDGTKHTLTVTIEGTNDVPVMQAQSTSVSEDAGRLDGQIQAHDTDTGDRLTYTTTSQVPGFTLDSDGHYHLDLSRSEYQSLPDNMSKDLVISVTVTDKSGAAVTRDLTITVTGANDGPVILSSSVATGGVTEDAATTTATGTLAASDVDTGATLSWSLNHADGTYGSLSIDPQTGAWTYTLDNSLAATQALVHGHVEHETFTATVTDEHGLSQHKTITIDVTGSRDMALAGSVTGSVTEDTTTTLSGDLTLLNDGTAVASGATHFGDHIIQGSYGTLDLRDQGHWIYHLDNNAPAVQGLKDQQVVEDRIHITLPDGTTHDVVIQVTGTGDAPVIDVGGLTPPAELGEVTQVSGFTGATDLSMFQESQQGVGVGHKLVALYMPGDDHNKLDGIDPGTLPSISVPYKSHGDTGFVYMNTNGWFSQNVTDVDSHAVAQNVRNNWDGGIAVFDDGTVVRLVKVCDGQNATEHDYIYFRRIDGANAHSGVSVLSGQSQAGEQVQVFDGSTLLGTVTADNQGNWQLGVDTLNDGDHVIHTLVGGTSSEPKTVEVAGNQITIHDSVPVIGTAEEDNSAQQQLSGQMHVTDADTGDNPVFTAQSATAGAYGTFSIDADGKWHYSLNNSARDTQALSGGQTVHETFVVEVTTASHEHTTETVQINVTGTNDAPVVTQVVAPVSVNETDALHFQVPANAFTEVEGQQMTFSATLADGSALPAWLHFDPATQSFTGHPDHADVGVISVSVIATDPSGASASQDFSLTVVDNVAPNVPTLDPLNPNDPHNPNINTGTPTFTGTAEPGSLITIMDGPTVLGTVTADNQGSYTFRPTRPLAEGHHAFSITATDTAGNQSSSSAQAATSVDTQTRPEITIDSVDNALQAHTDTSGGHHVHGTTNPGGQGHWTQNAYEVTSGDVTVHGSATGVPDGSTVTVQLTDQLNAKNSFSITAIVSNGQWSATIDHSQVDKVGTHDWQVEVSAADLFGNTVHTTTEIIDEDGLSKTLSENGATASLNLLGDNDGVQVGQVLYSLDGVHFSSQLPPGVTLDADGHTLQIDPANPAFDHLTPNDEAKVYVRYQLTETVDSATEHIFQSAVVTVTGSNDAPVVTATDVTHAADFGAIDEDSSKTFTTAELLNLVGASDADGDKLSISAVHIDSQYGSFTQQGDHWLFTPAANVHHDDIPITLQVSDGTAQTEAHATLDLTPVTDAAQVSLDILAEQTVVSFGGTEAGSANIKDIPNAQTLNALAVELTVVGDAHPAENGLMFALSTNDLQQVLNWGGFCVTKPQNLTILFGNGTTYETHINMNADPGSHRWSIVWNGDTGTLDILKDGQPIWHGDDVEKGYSLEANDAVALMGNVAYGDGHFDPNNDWKGEIFDLSVATTPVNPAALATAPLRDVAQASDLMLDVRVQGGQIVDSAGHNPITLTGAVSTVQAMVDTHVIPPNPGALLHLSPTITTPDPDDQVTGIHIGGFVTGTVLDDGQGHHHTITGPTDRVDISAWTLSGLTARLPQGDTTNMRVTLNVETTGPDGTRALSDSSAAVILDATAPIPDAVIGGDNTLATDQNTVVSGDLTVQDTDASQAHFTAQTDTNGQYGKFSIDEQGHWTYTPDARAHALAEGAPGKDTFTITTADGTSQLFTVNLTGTNDAPVITGPHAGRVDEDTDLTASGRLVVTDPDTGDSSTLSIVGSSSGAYGAITLDSHSGEWVYTLDNKAAQSLKAGQEVPEVFTVRATDSTGATSDQQITLTIHGSNDGPMVTAVDTAHAANLGVTNEDTEKNFSEAELLQLVGATDADNDELHVSAVHIDAQYGSFTQNADKSWTFHPATNFSSDHLPLTVEVTDGTETTVGKGEISISPVVDTATLRVAAEVVVNHYTSADFSTSAHNVDFDLTRTGFQSPGEGLAGGRYTVTSATGGVGDDTFRFSDLKAGDHFTIDGGSGHNALDLSAFDGKNVRLDTHAGTATVTLDGGGSAVIHFSNIQSVNFATDVFDGTPHGIKPVTGDWTIDGTHMSVAGGVSSQIALVDYAGSLQTDFTLAATVNAHHVDGMNTTGGIVFDYVDANNYKMAVLRAGQRGWNFEQYQNGQFSTLERVPDASMATADVDHQIELRVHGTVAELWSGGVMKATHDFGESLNGGQFGVIADRAHTDFQLAMRPSDWAPSAPSLDIEVDVSDRGVTTENVLAASVDHEGQAVALAHVDATSAHGGQVINNGDGTFRYVPADGFAGPDSFTYTVTDGINQTQATVRLNVVDLHTVHHVQPGEEFHLDIRAASTDTDGSETVSTMIAGLPPGTVVTDANHHETISAGQPLDVTGWNLAALTVEPAASQTDNYAFEVLTRSSEAGTDSPWVSTTLKVQLQPGQAYSDATFSGVDEQTGGEDSMLSGQLFVTDSNTADAHFVAMTNIDGTYGKFSIDEQGHWSYSPDDRAHTLAEGEHANEQFTVNSADGSSHIIQVSLTGTNDAPRVSSAIALPETEIDQPATLTTAELLANASDVDLATGETLSVVGLTADHGVIVDNGNGTFSFTPETGYHGPVQFSYRVQDALGGSTPATAIMTVSASSVASVDEDTLASGSIPLNAGDTLTAVEQEGSFGKLNLSADGTWSYTPDARANALTDGDSRTELFTVQSADGSHHSVMITLSGTDDAPEISGKTSAQLEQTSLSAQGALSVVDADDATYSTSFTAQSGTAGSYGSFSIDEHGNWNYQLDPNSAATRALAEGEQQTDTFHVTTADGQSHDVTVTVTGSNDAPTVVAVDTAHAADLGATDEDVAKTYTEADLLHLVGAHDVDNTELHVSAVHIDPQYGSFAKDATSGDWTFTPAANVDASHLAVTIEVTDNIAPPVTAQALLDITPVVDTPSLSLGLGGTALQTQTQTSTQLVPTVTAGMTTADWVPLTNFARDIYSRQTAFTSDTPGFDPHHIVKIVADGHELTGSFHYVQTAYGEGLVFDNFGPDQMKSVQNFEFTFSDRAPQQLSIYLIPDFNGHGDFSYPDGKEWGGTCQIDRGVVTTSIFQTANLNEDADVPLVITASTPDSDETLSFTISGLPAGATLSAGTHNQDGSWSLTPAQLPGLHMTPPADWSGDINLQVTATSHEGSLSASASNELRLTVTPVAETPTLTVTSGATVDEDSGAISLDIDLLQHIDPSETTSVQISGLPAGATLNHGTLNQDGSYTLTPADLHGLSLTTAANWSGNIGLQVTATSTEQTGESAQDTQSLVVHVNPVIDMVVTAHDVTVTTDHLAGGIPVPVNASSPDSGEVFSHVSFAVPTGWNVNLPDGSRALGFVDRGFDHFSISGSDIAGTHIVPPAGFTGDLPLTMHAVTHDGAVTQTIDLPITVSVVDPQAVAVDAALSPDTTPVSAEEGDTSTVEEVSFVLDSDPLVAPEGEMDDGFPRATDGGATVGSEQTSDTVGTGDSSPLEDYMQFASSESVHESGSVSELHSSAVGDYLTAAGVSPDQATPVDANLPPTEVLLDQQSDNSLDEPPAAQDDLGSTDLSADAEPSDLRDSDQQQDDPQHHGI